MKKIFSLLCISMLFFTACVSIPEEAPDPVFPVLPTSNVLLKSTIDVYEDGNVITTDFTYEGKKLVSVKDNSTIDPADFYITYTGNLITKIELKFEDGEVEQIETFEYNASNLLVTYTLTEPLNEYGFKYTYVHSTDGTIASTRYFGDALTQTEFDGTETITITNGEVTNITNSDGETINYTYDTKNHPLKNVIGLNKIAFIGGEADGVIHNITKIVKVTSETTTINYAYQYLNNYPIQSTQNEGDGEFTTQYFYE